MTREVRGRSGAGRHVPQRTCVACRTVKHKRELVRLVRLPDGSVEVDHDGKMVGRGAYLCRAHECWHIGLKNGRLEYALRTKLTRDNLGRLTDTAEAFEKANSQRERI